MKNFLRLAAALLLVALFGRVDVSAQVVTTQPEVITQDTKNVVITFHACLLYTSPSPRDRG